MDEGREPARTRRSFELRRDGASAPQLVPPSAQDVVVSGSQAPVPRTQPGRLVQVLGRGDHLEFQPSLRDLQDNEAHTYLDALTENFLTSMKEFRLNTAKARLVTSQTYVSKHSIHDGFEARWEGLGVAGWEAALQTAIVEMCIAVRTELEDSRAYAPEARKEEMCGGKGEGLIKVLKHFLVSDVSRTPSLDFPVLMDQRIRILYGFPEEGAEPAFLRPEGIRGGLRTTCSCGGMCFWP